MITRFPALVEAEVLRHLNNHHGDDHLLIVQELGHRPGARSAVAVGVDTAGIDFVVDGHGHGDGDGDRVRLSWPQPVSDRAAIRAAATALYQQACHKRGITPRPADATPPSGQDDPTGRSGRDGRDGQDAA